MDGKLLARLGAVVFVTVAIAATVIELTRKGEPSQPASPVRPVEPGADPLREGQRRCQKLGQKAAEDAECRRVWAQTRDRFLGRSPAPARTRSTDGQ
jgi:conjugative transfer region protein TrbK